MLIMILWWKNKENSLGTTKDFLGIEMKLSDKNFKKCYVRYQTLLGKQVTGGLFESAINVSAS